MPRALSGGAAVAGVIGWPVTHSLSPRLHGYWLARHDVDGAYVPLAVRPEHLTDALRALPRLGFAGANVTVPHKEAALTAVDTADDHARRIGAVNTVVVGNDGRLQGMNSDGIGFLESLEAGAPNWSPDDGPAVVIGAGGAARAIVVALIGAGVPSVRLVNRTRSRADHLAEAVGGPVIVADWAERPAALDGAALLVNATTLGMTGQPPLDLNLAALPPDAVVTDIVYAPLRTPLLSAAAARGNPVVDGLGMLLYQARVGFAAWFGVTPEVTEDLRAFVVAGGEA